MCTLQCKACGRTVGLWNYRGLQSGVTGRPQEHDEEGVALAVVAPSEGSPANSRELQAEEPAGIEDSVGAGSTPESDSQSAEDMELTADVTEEEHGHASAVMDAAEDEDEETVRLHYEEDDELEEAVRVDAEHLVQEHDSVHQQEGNDTTSISAADKHNVDCADVQEIIPQVVTESENGHDAVIDDASDSAECDADSDAAADSPSKLLGSSDSVCIGDSRKDVTVGESDCEDARRTANVADGRSSEVEVKDDGSNGQTETHENTVSTATCEVYESASQIISPEMMNCDGNQYSDNQDVQEVTIEASNTESGKVIDGESDSQGTVHEITNVVEYSEVMHQESDDQTTAQDVTDKVSNDASCEVEDQESDSQTTDQDARDKDSNNESCEVKDQESDSQTTDQDARDKVSNDTYCEVKDQESDSQTTDQDARDKDSNNESCEVKDQESDSQTTDQDARDKVSNDAYCEVKDQESDSQTTDQDARDKDSNNESCEVKDQESDSQTTDQDVTDKVSNDASCEVEDQESDSQTTDQDVTDKDSNNESCEVEDQESDSQNQDATAKISNDGLCELNALESDNQMTAQVVTGDVVNRDCCEDSDHQDCSQKAFDEHDKVKNNMSGSEQSKLESGHEEMKIQLEDAVIESDNQNAAEEAAGGLADYEAGKESDTYNVSRDKPCQDEITEDVCSAESTHDTTDGAAEATEAHLPSECESPRPDATEENASVPFSCVGEADVACTTLDAAVSNVEMCTTEAIPDGTLYHLQPSNDAVADAPAEAMDDAISDTGKRRGADECEHDSTELPSKRRRLRVSYHSSQKGLCRRTFQALSCVIWSISILKTASSWISTYFMR